VIESPRIDYLLDTSVLSHLFDPDRLQHALVKEWIDSLPNASRKVISAVALAELRFGQALAKLNDPGGGSPKLDSILQVVVQHDVLEIAATTAHEYAFIKSAVVAKYLPNRLRQSPKRGWGNPETWTDQFTGDALHIQENDLWQCAQAVERNLTFVSCDVGAERIAQACSGRLLVKLLRAGS